MLADQQILFGLRRRHPYVNTEGYPSYEANLPPLRRRSIVHLGPLSRRPQLFGRPDLCPNTIWLRRPIIATAPLTKMGQGTL